MELRIQHIMRNVMMLQGRTEFLRLCDRCRADKHRLSLLMQFFDEIPDRSILGPLRLIDEIRIIRTHDRFVRRYNDNRQIIDLDELIFLRLGCTGHPCQLAIHTEIVLERNRGQRLRLTLDLDPFFGLNRLMQTIRIAAAFHKTACELINDNDFTIAHYIITVTFHERFGPQSRGKAVRQLDILRRIKIADTEDLLNLRHSAVRSRNGLLLLIERVIRPFLESGYSLGHNGIHIR